MDWEYVQRAQKQIKRLLHRWGCERLAEDCTQQYVLTVLEGKAKHQIIKHFVIDFLRREFKTTTYEVQSDISISEAFVNDQVKTDNEIDMETMAKLCIRPDLFYMHYYLGFTYEEIGDKLDLSNTRIAQLLKRDVDFIKASLLNDNFQ